MRRVRVDLLRAAPAPSRPELLEPVERGRWERLRYSADRDRLFTGVLLRRVALSYRARRPVPVERRCRGCGAVDHGEVQPSAAADRARWRTSLSHAGDVVLLAVVEPAGDIEVGVDVEMVSRMHPELARYVLSPSEQSRLSEPTDQLLCRAWTAKEAALKALGCGLHASMTELDVGPSLGGDEPVVRVVGDDPRLRPLRQRPSRLVDITDTVCDGSRDGPALRAALVVLGTEEVDVRHRRLTAEDVCTAAPAERPSRTVDLVLPPGPAG